MTGRRARNAAAASLVALLLWPVLPLRAEPAPSIAPVGSIWLHWNGVRLEEPMGVHFDPFSGELFVADTRNHLVAIFDPLGMPKFTFGTEAGLFEPRQVVADPQGRIYVVGRYAQVEVFSYRGEPLGPFPFRDAGGSVEVVATAMAVLPDGGLLVADQLGSRILVYDRDWKFRRQIGRPGEGRGSLVAPVGIAVDPKGRIHVSDRSGIPVQVFSPRGRVEGAWGEHDLGAGNFSVPAGIAVDGKGRIFVADTLRHDVKVFDRTGKFLMHFGGFGAAPGDLAYPVGVAVGPDGLVYVSEKVPGRIQLFRLLEQGE